MNPGGETERALNRELSRSGKGDGLFAAPLRIFAPVGDARENRMGDVRQVQRGLGALDLASEKKRFEPSGILDRETLDGVRAFQRRNNLRIDGFLNPGGETETAMNIALRPAFPEGEEPQEQERDFPPVIARPLSEEDDDGKDGDGKEGDKPPPVPPQKPEPPEKEPEKKDCSDLETAMDNARSILQDREEALTEKQAEIEPLEAELEKLQVEIEEKTARLEKIDGPITAAGTAGGAAIAGIPALIATRNLPAAGRAAAKGAKGGKEVADAAIQALQAEITRLEAKAQELRTQLAPLQKEIQELESAVSEAESLASDAEAALEQCQGQSKE